MSIILFVLWSCLKLLSVYILYSLNLTERLIRFTSKLFTISPHCNCAQCYVMLYVTKECLIFEYLVFIMNMLNQSLLNWYFNCFRLFLNPRSIFRTWKSFDLHISCGTILHPLINSKHHVLYIGYDTILIMLGSAIKYKQSTVT